MLNQVFTMTQRLFVFIFLLAGSISLQAQTAKDIRTLSSFESISISGGFDLVELQQGDAESIAIEVSGVNPANIETKVRNNTLEIGMKKGCYNNMNAHIKVTYRKLKEVNNSGSSNVVVLGVLKSDEFEFNSSGSGSFKGELDVKDLDIAIAGSSDMKLSGNADDQEIAISGSGDVDASKLKGKKAEVAISGSGDVKLHVDGPVKTAVSGSGDVSNN